MEWSWQFWVVLGITLSIIEIMSLSFYLLAPILAAFILSFVNYLFPEFGLSLSLVSFAVSSMIFTIPMQRIAQKLLTSQDDEYLNEKAQSLIGSYVPIVQGQEPNYRVQIADGEWSAIGKGYEIGDRAKIIAIEGIALYLEDKPKS